MRFVKKYNLELMSIILLIFVVISVALWGSISWQRQMVVLYMVLLTLHEWEETRFPGGFYDMVLSGVNNGELLKMDPRSIHFFTACAVLLMLLPGWFFDSFRPFLMMPICLGCLEGCMHTAAIFIFHKKKPYTPGLCTALLMLIAAIYVLVTGFGGGNITIGSVLLGLVLMILLFFVFMQIVFRRLGISFQDMTKQFRT